MEISRETNNYFKCDFNCPEVFDDQQEFNFHNFTHLEDEPFSSSIYQRDFTYKKDAKKPLIQSPQSLPSAIQEESRIPNYCQDQEGEKGLKWYSEGEFCLESDTIYSSLTISLLQILLTEPDIPCSGSVSSDNILSYYLLNKDKLTSKLTKYSYSIGESDAGGTPFPLIQKNQVSSNIRHCPTSNTTHSVDSIAESISCSSSSSASNNNPHSHYQLNKYELTSKSTKISSNVINSISESDAIDSLFPLMQKDQVSNFPLYCPISSTVHSVDSSAESTSFSSSVSNDNLQSHYQLNKYRFTSRSTKNSSNGISSTRESNTPRHQEQVSNKLHYFPAPSAVCYINSNANATLCSSDVSSDNLHNHYRLNEDDFNRKDSSDSNSSSTESDVNITPALILQNQVETHFLYNPPSSVPYSNDQTIDALSCSTNVSCKNIRTHFRPNENQWTSTKSKQDAWETQSGLKHQDEVATNIYHHPALNAVNFLDTNVSSSSSDTSGKLSSLYSKLNKELYSYMGNYPPVPREIKPRKRAPRNQIGSTKRPCCTAFTNS